MGSLWGESLFGPIAVSIIFAAIGITGITVASLWPVKGSDRIALVFPVGSEPLSAVAALDDPEISIVKFSRLENVLVINATESSRHNLLKETGALFAINADGTSTCIKGGIEK